MSKVISTTVVNPNGKEDTCAYAVVDSKELYYLLSLVTAPDKYTISFFIKSLANETLTLWYGEESKEFEVTTSWQKITWNFSAEWVDNVMLQFTEGEYYIYNTMLERGNVATDYSMSQYDQKKVLKDMENTLNTKYAQLSIALDDITLEVSETSSKLGNVESSVKLMSDEIGLKVNKNGIIGAINLSSEQAQIMASKIDLVGAVTLSSLSSDVASKFDTLDDITVTDNNITYIDGGKIYTGSITADKIDVDDLFAEDITATGTIRGAILKSINYDEDTGVGMLLDLNNATIESRGEDFVNIFDSKGHYGRYTLAPEGMIFAEERDYLTGQPNLSITNGQLTLNNVKYNSYGINYGGSDIINWTTKGIATPKLSTDLIYCNGEIAAKTIKASVVQNSTYNLQSVGNMAVKNKQDIATINSNLDAGLPVDYDNLSYSEANNKYGALVTTTKTEYSTLNSRKFNDYAYLCFELLINGNSVRASIIIPSNRFVVQGYTVELSYVDSSNVQRWVSVTYKSDTSFYMVGSSNIVANNTRVHITGLKAKKSFDLYTDVQ